MRVGGTEVAKGRKKREEEKRKEGKRFFKANRNLQIALPCMSHTEYSRHESLFRSALRIPSSYLSPCGYCTTLWRKGLASAFLFSR